MRLTPGTPDPDTGVVFDSVSDAAALRPGDVLLIDEAGMLDQDTARALFTIADEHGARVALMGDRHQLPAVGRGGVLDLAARWAAPEACLSLDTVHRFTRTDTTVDGVAVRVADDEYAQLSLAMRSGADPAAVFDALLARDQIRLHASDAEGVAALARDAVDALTAGAEMVVVADTNEQVAALNAAIRERLVAGGRVDDGHAAIANAGQRLGVGDRVTTRRNDPNLGVANRDTWAITRAHRDGSLAVRGEHGERTLPPHYVREHVQLAYGSTVHGVQGDTTTTTAHALIGNHTSAASAYVGMTRGREANIAHLIAESVDDAREQWAAVFARDRADLGPAHAAELAATEAARYAPLRPLEEALDDLHQTWTVEQNCLERLAAAEQRRNLLVDVVALTADRDATVPPLKQTYHVARLAAHDAQQRAEQLGDVVGTEADGIAADLRRAWDQQRNAASQAARIVRDGPGRLGQRRSAVRQAEHDLERWSATWQPYLPSMPTDRAAVVAFAAWFDDTPRIHEAFDSYARDIAEHAHPEFRVVRVEAESAVQRRDEAWRAWRETSGRLEVTLSHYDRLAHHRDPAGYLAETEQAITTTRAPLDTAQQQVSSLLAEPTLRAQPAERIATERYQWRTDRDTAAALTEAVSAQRAADQISSPFRSPSMSPSGYDIVAAQSGPDHSAGISR